MPATLQCAGCVSPMGRAFACLPHELADQLARGIVPASYRRGQALFQQGTAALACYCIRSGSVKMSRRWANGHEMMAGTHGPGELLGVRALLAELPYAMSAEAIERLTVCMIPRDLFLELVRGSHELTLTLLKCMAIDSHLAEEQVIARAREDVSARTARLLVDSVRAYGGPEASVVEVAMSRERMALLVGTTRETLSRTLHGLARQGTIEIQDHAIRVLDLPALQALIE